MMEENFAKIKAIVEEVEGLELKYGKCGFRFPIYLTDGMASTEFEVLELSPRAINCLKRARYRTIGDLTNAVRHSSDLKKIRGCGISTVAEIMENLFCYQYAHLTEKKKVGFWEDVIRMNVA